MTASAAGEDEIVPYPHCILITLSHTIKLREESATDEAVNKNLDLSNELIKVELPP